MGNGSSARSKCEWRKEQVDNKSVLKAFDTGKRKCSENIDLNVIHGNNAQKPGRHSLADYLFCSFHCENTRLIQSLIQISRLNAWNNFQFPLAQTKGAIDYPFGSFSLYLPRSFSYANFMSLKRKRAIFGDLQAYCLQALELQTIN